MNDKVKILLVDDEVNSTILLKKVLSVKNYEVDDFNDSTKALDALQNGEYDIVISDLQMPGVSGMELLKAKPDDALFIMITGFGSVDSAVESMKLGAFDYINKPFNLEEFSLKVDKAVGSIQMKKQLKNLKSQVDESYSFGSIVGKSRKMQKVFEFIENVAKTNTNVLVEGASGTGKELVARAIHHNSARKNGPFIAINCSAIPENLLESELFGHTKGAYTGAVDAQKGVFEQAHGGTLLLDEIAEMPYNLQSKLLRVIEDWEVKPLGSDKVRKVDIRLISSTNQNLSEFIAGKKFREDLYYRISTLSVYLPPLNERKEDIPLLVSHFLKKNSDKLNRNFSIEPGAVEMLMEYDWKGNVRELENVIERALISTNEDKLRKSHFRFLAGGQTNNGGLGAVENAELKEVEKMYIKKVLEENAWNKLKAARVLGIDRKTLYNKIKEYGLE